MVLFPSELSFTLCKLIYIKNLGVYIALHNLYRKNYILWLCFRFSLFRRQYEPIYRKDPKVLQQLHGAAVAELTSNIQVLVFCNVIPRQGYICLTLEIEWLQKWQNQEGEYSGTFFSFNSATLTTMKNDGHLQSRHSSFVLFCISCLELLTK